MRNRAWCSVLMGGALVLAAAGAPGAEAPRSSEPAAEGTDWPVMITRLRQQYYQRPGHAQTRHQLATAYNNYGVSLGDQGQWDLAAQQLQEALRLDQQNRQFKTNLSGIYLNQAYDAFQRHDADRALATLEQILTVNPDFAPAYALRGEIEYTRQRLTEAKAAWQRALELDPSQTEIAERLERVSQELPVESKFEKISRAEFDLRYEEPIERPAGFDIRDVLLEARRVVGSDFAYWPRHKIVVLIYSAESFRKLRQETPEWVGGQFDGKIRVPLPSAQLNQVAVKQILFHEYTHAVIYDLTKGKCPTWLNEGLAEYEGRTQLPGSLALLAKAYQANQLVPWAELSEHISTALPAEEVGLAYEESYSVVAYFVTRYGFWRLRRLLKAIAEGRAWDTVMEQEFRINPSRLEAHWRQWLPEWLAGAR